MNNTEMSFREYLFRYLSFSVPETDAERMARSLAEKYGSLSYLASSSVNGIMSTDSVTKSAALSLKLLSYAYSRSITDAFTVGKKHTEKEITEFLSAAFIGLSLETVYAVFFDRSDRVIAVECLGEGTVNSSDVYPRRIVERSLLNGAYGVILAHNHPKGRTEPSESDLTSTSYLKYVLSTSGIRLIGHYLVNETECCKIEIEEE